MSLEHGYCSLDKLKARLGLQSSDSRDDEALEGLIEAVSRAIDAECFGGESQFYALDNQTRYYTASNSDELIIDQLLSISSLKTDHDGDGTMDITWALTDYVLAPYNAPVKQQPYWKIERMKLGKNWFPFGHRRGVQVVGSWGWCTDIMRPKQVETVCLRESQYAFSATRTPYGATTGDGSTAMAPSISLSNYSKLMLSPFRRVTVS